MKLCQLKRIMKNNNSKLIENESVKAMLQYPTRHAAHLISTQIITWAIKQLKCQVINDGTHTIFTLQSEKC